MRRFRISPQLVNGLWLIIIGCSIMLTETTSIGADDDSKLVSKTVTLRKGEKRITTLYRSKGNTAGTNKVCVIYESHGAGGWVVSSRFYYVDGKDVLTEQDFDENGVAGKLLIRNGDRLVGVLRRGNQITGVVPQSEIDEIIEMEKSGTAAGEAIGSIIGTGKDHPTKTVKETAEEVKRKYEELRKKQAQEKQ